MTVPAVALDDDAADLEQWLGQRAVARGLHLACVVAGTGEQPPGCRRERTASVPGWLAVHTRGHHRHRRARAISPLLPGPQTSQVADRASAGSRPVATVRP